MGLGGQRQNEMKEIPAQPNDSRWGRFVFLHPFICVSLCFSHDISKTDADVTNRLNVTQECSTMSPGNPLFWSQKVKGTLPAWVCTLVSAGFFYETVVQPSSCHIHGTGLRSVILFYCWSLNKELHRKRRMSTNIPHDKKLLVICS